MAAQSALPEEPREQSSFDIIKGKVFACLDPKDENNFHMFYFAGQEGWEVEFLIGDNILFVPVELGHLSETQMLLEQRDESGPYQWTHSTNIGRLSLSFSTQVYEKVGDEAPKLIRSFEGQCSILERSFETKEELEAILTKKAF